MKIPILNAAKYHGQLVALDPKTYRVISHDPIFRKARAAAKKQGIKRPLMRGVPESDGYFGRSISLHFSYHTSMCGNEEPG